MWCKKQRQKVMTWDKALRDWQDNFNASELSHINHFVKTQSRCLATYTDKGKQRHTERWIAIALTPEESIKLRGEPHIFGDIENGCCGGPNEEECCMHP